MAPEAQGKASRPVGPHHHPALPHPRMAELRLKAFCALLEQANTPLHLGLGVQRFGCSDLLEWQES